MRGMRQGEAEDVSSVGVVTQKRLLVTYLVRREPSLVYFRHFRFRSLSIHATAFLSINQFVALNYQPSFRGPPRVLGALRAVRSLRIGSGGPGLSPYVLSISYSLGRCVC